MISTLHIKNIGIIDDVLIDFNDGLNVITGETGAGKTLIVDSLGIIAGGRFSKDMIRKGENNSFVELCLYIPNNPISIDGNIIVSREINSNGRNLCKINGRLVTVNELKEFMKNIIDIHGQYDNQTLMDKSYHTKYMDSFIGNNIELLKEQYIEMYRRYNEIKRVLKANYGDDKEKQRKLDLLKYQMKEIEAANLKIGEEDELESKRNLMMNAEKILENLNNVDNNLNNSAIDVISDSIRSLEKIKNIDKCYEEKLNELKNIYYEIQELARDISGIKDNISFDEQERNEVETRIDVIQSLKRKYGNSIKEILEYKKDVQREIENIENAEEINEKLREKLKSIEEKMQILAEEMTKIRKDKSIELTEKINEQLHDLEMKNAKFNVLMKKNNDFLENGIDDIEFMIRTNIGDEEKALIKIASGGEVSRIMLAIKTVLADTDKVPVMIFDEIDTGISGKAAKSVAEKMKIIAKKHQVLCITHQANIAAKGDYNYYISKNVQGENTVTSVKLLSEDEVINEIARISSGDITQTAINHAKEMRKAV